jgi:hypothetical protein
MKISIIILSVFFVLLGCETDHKKQSAKEEMILSKFPLLLNLDKVDIKPFLENEENPTWISTGYYRCFYMGKQSDTVALVSNSFRTLASLKKGKKRNIPYQNPFEKYCILGAEQDCYSSGMNTLIEIQANTSIISKNSFPVLIRNHNKDTVSIGYGAQIQMTMEAIDNLGKWKPIQEKYKYTCGLGIGTIILPPNEILITFAPIYKGNYKTQLRLALGNNKSKPFAGNINYRQFKW